VIATLDHAVALVGEEVVGLLDLIEPEAVRDELRDIQLAVAYELHQGAHALLAARATAS
jgi:hypothetical protein